jgi:hypothetical protein
VVWKSGGELSVPGLDGRGEHSLPVPVLEERMKEGEEKGEEEGEERRKRKEKEGRIL